MPIYRKRPIMVEATQWFKNGDHPVVGLLQDSNLVGDVKCPSCNNARSKHGVCPTLEGYHIVCPGDWIITGIQGEYYPCKPEIFEATYELVGEATE